MIEYEIINLEKLVDMEPNKQYNTRVVNTEWKGGKLKLELEYMGTEYDPKYPQCLFPISDNSDFHIHPFVD